MDFVSSSAAGYEIEVWDQLKYYYLINAWLPKSVVFDNAKAFSPLDKEKQQVLIMAGRGQDQGRYPGMAGFGREAPVVGEFAFTPLSAFERDRGNVAATRAG